jgi:hypothetical protein
VAQCATSYLLVLILDINRKYICVQQIRDPIQGRNKLGFSISSLLKKTIPVKVQEFLKWKIDLLIYIWVSKKS